MIIKLKEVDLCKIQNDIFDISFWRSCIDFTQIWG